MVPFDEALRDVSVIQPIVHNPEQGVHDPVAQHGAQFLEIKNTERKGKCKVKCKGSDKQDLALLQFWGYPENPCVKTGQGRINQGNKNKAIECYRARLVPIFEDVKSIVQANVYEFLKA